MGQPALNKLSYWWQVCTTDTVNSCSSVSKAGPTYQVPSTAVGKRIRLLVGVTVGSGANTTTAWDASPISDVVTVTGKLTGTPTIVLGSGLSAPVRWTEISVSAGWAYRWQGVTTYQWQTCSTADPKSCADIPFEKATRPKFAPNSRYVGSGIRAVVTYTGPDGTKVSGATAISSPLARKSRH
jgi:hypothetical protein